MSEFKIERVAPPPTVREKYPWSEMSVGDSFFAPIDAMNLRGCAGWQARRYGRKFTIRKEGHGARAYRIA